MDTSEALIEDAEEEGEEGEEEKRDEPNEAIITFDYHTGTYSPSPLPLKKDQLSALFVFRSCLLCSAQRRGRSAVSLHWGR